MSDKLHRLHKLHLIVPGAALPTGEALPHLPELRALLAGMAPAGRIECTEDDPATPFELALAQAHGLPGEPGYIPWAAFETDTIGLPCAWIQLCHWQVGTSHVMLAPPQDLALDAATSASLLAAMAPYFLEDGIHLQPWPPNGNLPGVWLATGEPLRHLRTVSMERMSGARLTPTVLDGAPAIRRLQNEMQMLLYTHPLSDERAQRGLQPVNSFWISGAGVLDQPVPAAAVPVEAGRADDGDSFKALLAILRAGGDARLTLCGEHAAQSFAPARTGFIGKLKSTLGLQSAWNGWDTLWNITARDVPPRAAWALEQAGVHPLLARLYASRGVTSPGELDDSLAHLLAPPLLHGTQQAAALLADAIRDGIPLCVVADYDCDGATACAVAVRGLKLLGAKHVQYLVPDRVVDGYGLTPPIAERVKAAGAGLLITVDNGIASMEGVATARALGLQVLVTDHHLPASVDGQVVLPDADVLVNPNQPACSFPSKCIAGVGVMFYVLLALRAELRTRGVFDATTQPKLDVLLPLVALGTVADVVKLDANNRRLVAQGLRRIRAGQMPAGLAALFSAAGRNAKAATTFDFGFALGPRINAAGRLADMTIGIECLLTDDAGRAAELARTLDGINRERREIEGGMREQALVVAESLFNGTDNSENNSVQAAPAALCVFDAGFHEGVVGIVASRLKDKLHRPTFVFAASQAPGHEDELKGSGRSIPGFHLRDALDLVAKRHPGVLLRFGGHAMAAGCTIARGNFDTFRDALAQVAREWLDAATLTRRIDTDGPLAAEYRRVDLVDTLHREVWGQGFAPPTFSEEVEVLSQRLVADKHLALKLKHQGQPIDGIWFGHTEPLPARVVLAFRLDADEWQGVRRVRFLVEGAA